MSHELMSLGLAYLTGESSQGGNSHGQICSLMLLSFNYRAQNLA